MRTDLEIKQALNTLLLNKLSCSQFNIFGNDNCAAIDVMIDIIENKRSIDYAFSNYPTEDGDGNLQETLYLWQAAMSALDWMRDLCPLEDILFPVRILPPVLDKSLLLERV